MQDIDIEKAKNQFIEFTNQYDLKEPHINRKVKHSLRVMEISKKIATLEGFSEEEIKLATLIGLLHDIARFKQYTQYQTFSDFKSFDHGAEGEKILESNLRDFISTNKYDEIIKTAVRNHNKFEIEQGLTDEQIKFCKLVRDADKLDIFFEATEYFFENDKEKIENSKITQEVKQDFIMQKTYKKQKGKQLQDVDRVIQILSFIFDINYKSSFKIIKEENYIEKIINQFEFKNEETKQEISNLKTEANEYIEKRLK